MNFIIRCCFFFVLVVCRPVSCRHFHFSCTAPCHVPWSSIPGGNIVSHHSFLGAATGTRKLFPWISASAVLELEYHDIYIHAYHDTDSMILMTPCTRERCACTCCSEKLTPHRYRPMPVQSCGLQATCLGLPLQLHKAYPLVCGDSVMSVSDCADVNTACMSKTGIAALRTRGQYRAHQGKPSQAKPRGLGG